MNLDKLITTFKVILISDLAFETSGSENVLTEDDFIEALNDHNGVSFGDAAYTLVTAETFKAACGELIEESGLQLPDDDTLLYALYG